MCIAVNEVIFYPGHGPTPAGFGMEWCHFQPQMLLQTTSPGKMVVLQVRPTYPSPGHMYFVHGLGSVNLANFVVDLVLALCKFIMIAAKMQVEALQLELLAPWITCA